MFSRWPIKFKLLLGVGGLCVMVVTLAAVMFSVSHSYRDFARSLSNRASESPLTIELITRVGHLRATLSRAHAGHSFPSVSATSSDMAQIREEFCGELNLIRDVLGRYRRQLESNAALDSLLNENHGENRTMEQIDQALGRIEHLVRPEAWTDSRLNVDALGTDLDNLETLSAELPSHLQRRMQNFCDEVRDRYRFWVSSSIAAVVGALVLSGVVMYVFWRWVLLPLDVLIASSRRVARNEFSHRVTLNSCDELGELAAAMNAMIANFQQTRDELDQQVRERTAEVVRSERLASVGFLAAGVAHEINNPMASIAWAAEAIEQRMFDLFGENVPGEGSPDIEIICKYAKRIQDEAFRCKGITERLLDFSRMGDVEKQATDLGELIEDIVAMVRIGNYKQKNIQFRRLGQVVAPVNPQEIKQVMLNLITNALDSLEPGGTVWVDLAAHSDRAEICVTDDGCGMSPEVLLHLYEPFFTRRRDGQGTGLGLSITHRIVVDDHGGRIEASSDGPGAGSRFKVTLPLTPAKKEYEKRHQAA